MDTAQKKSKLSKYTNIKQHKNSSSISLSSTNSQSSSNITSQKINPAKLRQASSNSLDSTSSSVYPSKNSASSRSTSSFTHISSTSSLSLPHHSLHSHAHPQQPPNIFSHGNDSRISSLSSLSAASTASSFPDTLTSKKGNEFKHLTAEEVETFKKNQPPFLLDLLKVLYITYRSRPDAKTRKVSDFVSSEFISLDSFKSSSSATHTSSTSSTSVADSNKEFLVELENKLIEVIRKGGYNKVELDELTKKSIAAFYNKYDRKETNVKKLLTFFEFTSAKIVSVNSATDGTSHLIQYIKFIDFLLSFKNLATNKRKYLIKERNEVVSSKINPPDNLSNFDKLRVIAKLYDLDLTYLQQIALSLKKDCKESILIDELKLKKTNYEYQKDDFKEIDFFYTYKRCRDSNIDTAISYFGKKETVRSISQSSTTSLNSVKSNSTSSSSIYTTPGITTSTVPLQTTSTHDQHNNFVRLFAPVDPLAVFGEILKSFLEKSNNKDGGEGLRDILNPELVSILNDCIMVWQPDIFKVYENTLSIVLDLYSNDKGLNASLYWLRKLAGSFLKFSNFSIDLELFPKSNVITVKALLYKISTITVDSVCFKISKLFPVEIEINDQIENKEVNLSSNVTNPESLDTAISSPATIELDSLKTNSVSSYSSSDTKITDNRLPIPASFTLKGLDYCLERNRIVITEILKDLTSIKYNTKLIYNDKNSSIPSDLILKFKTNVESIQKKRYSLHMKKVPTTRDVSLHDVFNLLNHIFKDLYIINESISANIKPKNNVGSEFDENSDNNFEILDEFLQSYNQYTSKRVFTDSKNIIKYIKTIKQETGNLNDNESEEEDINISIINDILDYFNEIRKLTKFSKNQYSKIIENHLFDDFFKILKFKLKKIDELCNSSLRNDDFKYLPNVPFSKSVQQLFEIFELSIKEANDLNWSDKFQNAKLLTLCYEHISNNLIKYSNGLTSDINENLITTNYIGGISQESFVKINNLFEILKRMDNYFDLPKNDLFRVSTILNKAPSASSVSGLSSPASSISSVSATPSSFTIDHTPSKIKVTKSLKRKQKLISLTILNAENVEDSNGTPLSSFIRIIGGGIQDRTRIINSNSFPIWNEEFETITSQQNFLPLELVLFTQKGNSLHQPTTFKFNIDFTTNASENFPQVIKLSKNTNSNITSVSNVNSHTPTTYSSSSRVPSASHRLGNANNVNNLSNGNNSSGTIIPNTLDNSNLLSLMSLENNKPSEGATRILYIKYSFENVYNDPVFFIGRARSSIIKSQDRIIKSFVSIFSKQLKKFFTLDYVDYSLKNNNDLTQLSRIIDETSLKLAELYNELIDDCFNSILTNTLNEITNYAINLILPPIGIVNSNNSYSVAYQNYSCKSGADENTDFFNMNNVNKELNDISNSYSNHIEEANINSNGASPVDNVNKRLSSLYFDKFTNIVTNYKRPPLSYAQIEVIFNWMALIYEKIFEPYIDEDELELDINSIEIRNFNKIKQLYKLDIPELRRKYKKLNEDCKIFIASTHGIDLLSLQHNNNSNGGINGGMSNNSANNAVIRNGIKTHRRTDSRTHGRNESKSHSRTSSLTNFSFNKNIASDSTNEELERLISLKRPTPPNEDSLADLKRATSVMNHASKTLREKMALQKVELIRNSRILEISELILRVILAKDFGIGKEVEFVKNSIKDNEEFEQDVIVRAEAKKLKDSLFS